jgi:transaldolase / glucose-6-phosphate isomerase
VASFFVSRIDTAIDAQVTARLRAAQNAEERMKLGRLRGRVAIANARLAYQRYLDLFDSSRWHELSRRGAQRQRLLWASTSTKNADYRDVVYVEELIGADTVNTIPPATFDAFREHGEARDALTEGVDAAVLTMQGLEAGHFDGRGRRPAARRRGRVIRRRVRHTARRYRSAASRSCGRGHNGVALNEDE